MLVIITLFILFPQVLRDRSELLTQLELTKSDLAREVEHRASLEMQLQELKQAVGETERRMVGLTQGVHSSELFGG